MSPYINSVAELGYLRGGSQYIRHEVSQKYLRGKKVLESVVQAIPIRQSLPSNVLATLTLPKS